MALGCINLNAIDRTIQHAVLNKLKVEILRHSLQDFLKVSEPLKALYEFVLKI